MFSTGILIGLVPQMNSPRSLEACKREGINPKILCYRPLKAFGAPGKPYTLQEAEFNQYEKKRQRTFLDALLIIIPPKRC